MTMIFVTPRAGARVRMPDRNSAVMPSAGYWVPRTVHYETLISCGDIIVSDPQPAQPGVEADPAPAETEAKAAEPSRAARRP